MAGDVYRCLSRTLYITPYVSPTDTSLCDGLFHEYKKQGKVTGVTVSGQGGERIAVVTFKRSEVTSSHSLPSVTVKHCL